jgi:membrane protease YdiL (CAAX protease family)
MPENRSILQSIFISEDEPRLRAGWRLILHALLVLVTSIVIGVLWSSLVIAIDVALPSLNLAQRLGVNELAVMALEVLTITIATWIARRYLDHRTFRSLGFSIDRSTWSDLVVGFLLSAFLFLILYLTTTILGWSQFESWAWENENLGQVLVGVTASFLLFVGAAYQEELLSRGYHLQNLAQGTNLPLAVLLSSLIFSLLHLGNPNVSWMAIVGLLAAGFFLAYAYLRTKSLWLPIGIHLGWNFFEGTVFGFPVSGMNSFSLIRQQSGGPDLLLGGMFGPEAGLIILPVLLLGAWLIRLYTKRNDHSAASA